MSYRALHRPRISFFHRSTNAAGATGRALIVAEHVMQAVLQKNLIGPQHPARSRAVPSAVVIKSDDGVLLYAFDDGAPSLLIHRNFGERRRGDTLDEIRFFDSLRGSQKIDDGGNLGINRAALVLRDKLPCQRQAEDVLCRNHIQGHRKVLLIAVAVLGGIVLDWRAEPVAQEIYVAAYRGN